MSSHENNNQSRTTASRGISPTKVDQNAAGILAGLFRRILIARGLADESSGLTSQWHAQLDRYLNDPANGSYKDVRERQSVRGGLQKELFKPYMSWKVFLKALRVMGLPKIKFTVEWETRNGKVQFTTLTVDTSAGIGGDDN